MDDPPPYTEELQDLFRIVRKQYESIKQKATSYVVRWEWTNGMRYDLRPFYCERIGQRRGDVARRKPSGVSFYHYGISAENRVIIEESYYRGKLEYEAFWQNLPDKIEIMYYEAGQMIRIARLDSHQAQPQRYRRYDRKHGVDSGEQEFYTWENGKLVKIAWQMDKWFETVNAEVYCFYDDDGELSRIEGSPGWMGFVPQIYKRPAAEPASMPGTLAQRQTLVDAIVETLAQANISEPVCAVVLNYSTSDGMFPPQISLLSQADRQKRVDEGETAIELLWTLPWMLTDDEPLEIRNAEVLTLCEKLEQEFDTEQARTLLAQIAGDLIQVNWTGKLPVTDDFIAFSMDYEIDDAVERIPLSAPQYLLDMLRGKGLL